MTERKPPNPLALASVVLDAAIVLIFLFMPRSGMEAMGAAFLLYPLLVIRIVAAIISLVLSLRRGNWELGTYTVAAVAVLAWLWVVGAELEPTYEPLHKVLRQELKAQAQRLSDYRDQRAYDNKRAQQRRADPAHARLCDLLSVERNLIALDALAGGDVNRPCATYYGDAVSPLLHAIIHSYGPWSGGPLAHRPVDEAFLAPAAERLLAAGADPDSRDSYGNTALHYALIFQNEALLETLLASRACVLLRNQLGESPLSTHSSYRLRKKIEAAANNPDILSRCPGTTVPPDTAGADPEDPAVLPPDAGLLSALRSGRLELAITHLKRGANPNAQDHEGSSFDAALRNCRDNALTLAQLLLDAGANINLKNRRGETALSIAMYSCPEAVPFLLERGADPSVADRRGDTVLHDLVHNDPASVAALLDGFLAAGADINQQNRSGQTPLIRAAYGSADRHVTALALLERGADPNLQDRYGNTALHELARRKDDAGALEMIEALLARGAALEIRNRKQQTPLITAVRSGSPAITGQLINAGADVNVRRARGGPLIGSLISCEAAKLEKLKLLVNAGADTSAKSEHGPLPLAQAFYGEAYLDCLDPARVLLAADADPNLRDQNGTAPIHGIATWSEKDPDAALTLLAEHGGQIDLRNEQGVTTLLLAARYGTSIRTLERLLAHGADPEARDDKGNTLLHHAAMNQKPGNAERLSWVLANGGNLEATNLAGQTPLDRARVTGNEAMVQALQSLQGEAPG